MYGVPGGGQNYFPKWWSKVLAISTYVITVCSRDAEERCPIFPGPSVRYNWPFDDPSSFSGTEAEILEQTRVVRDAIKAQIADFARSICERHATP